MRRLRSTAISVVGGAAGYAAADGFLSHDVALGIAGSLGFIGAIALIYSTRPAK